VEAIEERASAQGPIAVGRKMRQSSADMPQSAGPQAGPSARGEQGEPSEAFVRVQPNVQPATAAKPALQEGPSGTGSGAVSRDLDALYPEWCFG
jgi:hypothetical protein